MKGDRGPRKNNGYIMIYRPNFDKSFREGKHAGYTYEHIYVMEVDIGHVLQENEVVHHIDGNKLNNHPTNLIWLDTGQHTKLHNRLRKVKEDKETLNYYNFPHKNDKLKKKLETFHNTLSSFLRNGENYKATGRELGISDSAVKKRLTNVTFELLNGEDETDN